MVMSTEQTFRIPIPSRPTSHSLCPSHKPVLCSRYHTEHSNVHVPGNQFSNIHHRHQLKPHSAVLDYCLGISLLIGGTAQKSHVVTRSKHHIVHMAGLNGVNGLDGLIRIRSGCCVAKQFKMLWNGPRHEII